MTGIIDSVDMGIGSTISTQKTVSSMSLTVLGTLSTTHANPYISLPMKDLMTVLA